MICCVLLFFSILLQFHFSRPPFVRFALFALSMKRPVAAAVAAVATHEEAAVDTIGITRRSATRDIRSRSKNLFIYVRLYASSDCLKSI